MGGYQAVDQYGQVIDVLHSALCRADAAPRFFRQPLSTLKVKPTEAATGAAAVYPAVLNELVPSMWHHVEQYANDPIDSRLKYRLRTMHRLRTQEAPHVIAGHVRCRWDG